MPRKYNHIVLPRKMVGPSKVYTVTKGPNPQGLLPISEQEDVQRRATISSGLNKVKEVALAKTDSPINAADTFYDLKISLRKGSSPAFLERIGVKPYRTFSKEHAVKVQDELKEYKEDIVLGKVSTVKLPNENESDFDKLRRELTEYIEHGLLPSYYDQILDIKPLTIDEVADPALLEDLEGNGKVLTDFVFSESQDRSSLKFSTLADEFGDNFLMSINTPLSHYCRILVNKSEAEKIVSSYKGIIEIAYAPIFHPSAAIAVESENLEITDDTSSSVTPILVVDQPVYGAHPVLEGVFVDQMGDTAEMGTHGTQVGSLVVYGRNLRRTGPITQQNKIIGVNAFLKVPGTDDYTFNEPLVKEAVEMYQSTSRALIVNLSANDPNIHYSRLAIHRTTVFLDELSHRYNCVFTISAGNMNEIKNYYAAGVTYPDYYDYPNTTILAPADSINNITVGSIIYQASTDSIAKIKHPSPITRRGFENKKYGFVKPDLVHFDSNLIYDGTDLREEYNGPIQAFNADSTTQDIGTSFAAPLVANELGLLAARYPSYKAQTLKGLLLHFAELPDELPDAMTPERVKSLLGYGQTSLTRALDSLNTSTTLVIENSIGVDALKEISIPIPSVIAGSQRKRMKLRLSLIYSPLPNPKEVSSYCPINLSAQIIREDDHEVNRPTTSSYLSGAHRKSNFKRYPAILKNTAAHMGKYWKVAITSTKISDYLPDTYKQPFTLILTIEDMEKDDNLDIHADITQMIDVYTEATVDVNAS